MTSKHVLIPSIAEGKHCLAESWEDTLPCTVVGAFKYKDLQWNKTEGSRKYIQLAKLCKERGNSRPIPPIMSILAEYDNNAEESEFAVELDTQFCAQLHSLLPDPYLLVQFKLQDDENGNVLNSMEERITVQRVVLNEYDNVSLPSYTKTWFSVGHPSGLRDLDCIFTIHLGWDEPARYLHFPIPYPFMDQLWDTDEGGIYKDLTVVSGDGIELQCHKFILAAHSEVLLNTFSNRNGMMESQTGKLTIQNFSGEVIMTMLRYMYGIRLSMQELSSDIIVN